MAERKSTYCRESGRSRERLGLRIDWERQRYAFPYSPIHYTRNILLHETFRHLGIFCLWGLVIPWDISPRGSRHPIRLFTSWDISPHMTFYLIWGANPWDVIPQGIFFLMGSFHLICGAIPCDVSSNGTCSPPWKISAYGIFCLIFCLVNYFSLLVQVVCWCPGWGRCGPSAGWLATRSSAHSSTSPSRSGSEFNSNTYCNN